MNKGYWQFAIKESDKCKTAFVDDEGLYEFNVLPFGLTGAPAIFQRGMDFILMDVAHAMVYIDDIIIFSKDFDEHLADIETVFKRLKLANLKIRATKCDWAKPEVIYIGHVISKDGLKPNPARVNKVKDFPIPKNIDEVRSFLGLANYYRKFIQNFSHIAHPINSLLRKNATFQWKQNQQEAFDLLKNKLITSPILRHPNMTKPFILMTDASGYAIGAVLGQQDGDEKDHVIAYASRALKKHEKNYSTIEKEALAIVFAVTHFRQYLLGHKIILYTDHNPLKWLMNHRDVASKLIRWVMCLQQFDIEIRYRTGKSNANADTLSRIKEENVDESKALYTILSAIKTVSNMSEFQIDQESDEEINQIKIQLQRKAYNINPKELKQCGYFIQDNLVKYYNGINTMLLVPKKHRETLLMQYHDGALGGHLSARKTVSRLKTKYYWTTIENDTRKWCKSCKICITRRNTGAKFKVPLVPMPVPAAPMEFAAMDIVGPLPETQDGNKYILVFCDYLTKWPEAFAIKNQKAETIAQVFVENIVFRLGTPKKILTDCGKNFLSEIFKAITELFSILKLNTSPYHPQTDGLVERFNGTLINMLSSYTGRTQRDWDLYINPCYSLIGTQFMKVPEKRHFILCI